jgi:hypothetical protein
MAKLKTEVVEVIGDNKQFNVDLNYKLDDLSDSEIISISISTSETTKGTRYVAVILHRFDR